MSDRKSFWIPKRDRWICSALDSVKKEAAKEGINLSDADIILAALIPFLEKYKTDVAEEENVNESRNEKNVNESSYDVVNPYRSVVCRKKDMWFLNCLDRIVEGRKTLGLKTSFSSELFRLAKNGLYNEVKGKNIDLRILQDADSPNDDR